MVKEILSARINQKTEAELEEYADELKISKSEATDRLLNKAIRIEKGDVEIVPVRSDGGQIEDRLVDTQNQLSKIENGIQKNNLNYVVLAVGLAYIIIQLTVGLPSELGLATGIPLIIALVYVNLLR